MTFYYADTVFDKDTSSSNNLVEARQWLAKNAILGLLKAWYNVGERGISRLPDDVLVWAKVGCNVAVKIRVGEDTLVVTRPRETSKEVAELALVVANDKSYV